MGIDVLLVDALNLIRRVYAAQPGVDGPQRAEDALRSSCQSLRRALRESQPTHALCVFEAGQHGWRQQLFPAYKANHAPMPAALEERLPDFRKAFLEIGVRSFSQAATEADDVLATLATKVAAGGGRATILSTDKAFLQLLSVRIGVRDHFSGRNLDRVYVREKFGIEPEQLVDFLALTGDSTNGIPGVPGIGGKTAAKLLGSYGSLSRVLVSAAAIKGVLGQRLQRHPEDARLSQTLARLQTDLELGINLKSLRYSA